MITPSKSKMIASTAIFFPHEDQPHHYISVHAAQSSSRFYCATIRHSDHFDSLNNSDMKSSAELPKMLFESAQQWEAWLKEHHAKSPGLRLQIAKKESGHASVSYDV